MSALGMGSSSAHHVSRFRATEDWPSLNRMLSATLTLVLYTMGIAVVVSAVVFFLTPTLMAREPRELIGDAQWMVVAMGIAAVLQMLTVVYGGVLVGSHRFGLFNLVDIFADVAVVVGVLVCLFAGWGLKAMAFCIAARNVLDLVAKRSIAHRLCPQLQLRLRWSDGTRFKEIASYGSKTLADSLASIILQQNIVAIVVFFHGAAAVALLSRPLALIRMTTRFVMGFARVLAPRAGAARELGDRDRLRRLLTDGTRTCLLLALPVVAILLIMGGPLLRFWMGDAYADETVLVILAIGYLPHFAQRSTWHILLGMGVHGLPSAASLVGAIVSVGLGLLFVGPLGWGLVGAALAVAIPMAVVGTLVLPYAGCRAVGLKMWPYVSRSCAGPVVLVLPLAAVLAIARLAFRDQPLTALAVGGVAGAPVCGIVYWRYGFSERLKDRIVGAMARHRPRGRWTLFGR